MNPKQLSAAVGLLTALIIGVYQIGKADQRHNEASAASPAAYGLICSDGSAPKVVPIAQANSVGTPTATSTATATLSSPTPTPEVPRTLVPATATAGPQPAATPTLMTGTPSSTVIPSTDCWLIPNGAARAEPKGMVWYSLTQAGITYQNVRNAPVGGNVVGKIIPNTAYTVRWQIQASGSEWYALDEPCNQWIAGSLGTISIHP